MEQQQKRSYRDQIAELQTQIANLRGRAVLELRVKIVDCRNQIAEYERQLEKLNSDAPTYREHPRQRTFARVGIKEIASAIQGGAVNYLALKRALKCGIPFLRKKILAEGKAAGISSVGSGTSFRLRVK